MVKISQNVSSDSLFHFIRKIDWLLEILESKSFQARYVYENTLEADYKAGIAMKCFCDIPLGVIKKHIHNYGKFGIGVKKSFAKKNYVTPVIYFHDNSDTYYRYISSIGKNDVFGSRFSLFPYFKVDSRMSIKDGRKKIERFYDEREWRFIPREAELVDCTKLSDLEAGQKLKKLNNKLVRERKAFLLPFDYDDITYIFVQFEKDIDSVIDVIKKIDTTEKQRDRLIAKIITSRQIERDF
jgi:hypothetical protein